MRAHRFCTSLPASALRGTIPCTFPRRTWQGPHLRCRPLLCVPHPSPILVTTPPPAPLPSPYRRTWTPPPTPLMARTRLPSTLDSLFVRFSLLPLFLPSSFPRALRDLDAGPDSAPPCFPLPYPPLVTRPTLPQERHHQCHLLLAFHTRCPTYIPNTPHTQCLPGPGRRPRLRAARPAGSPGRRRAVGDAGGGSGGGGGTRCRGCHLPTGGRRGGSKRCWCTGTGGRGAEGTGSSSGGGAAARGVTTKAAAGGGVAAAWRPPRASARGSGRAVPVRAATCHGGGLRGGGGAGAAGGHGRWGRQQRREGEGEGGSWGCRGRGRGGGFGGEGGAAAGGCCAVRGAYQWGGGACAADGVRCAGGAGGGGTRTCAGGCCRGRWRGG